MNTEIFIVSCKRDVEFLRYCLKSIERFSRGFSGVRVLVPRVDQDLFSFVKETAVLEVYDEHPTKGMLDHEAQIMGSDVWCPNADAILHLDSDCIFWEPVTPDDYFVDGKPILYRERYSTLTNKLRLNWWKAVNRATKIDAEWETMVRHPAVHIREVYPAARALITEEWGMWARDYILTCENSFPQTFAEFPTLGAVAIKHFADKYHFLDYDVRTPDGGYDYVRGKDKLTAHWSHGGIDRYRKECEEILK